MRHSPDDMYYDVQLSFSADNKKIEVFSYAYGEYENTLFDELNDFIEYDFSIIYKYKSELDRIYNTIYDRNETFDDIFEYQRFMEICEAIAKSFEEQLPGLSMSLQTLLEDKYSLTDCLNIDLVLAMEEIWEELESIAVMQGDIESLFYDLSEVQKNNTDRKNVPFSQHYTTIVTEMNLSYNEGVFKYTVITDTPRQFYAALVIFFFSSQPLISLCEYCGRYFTPKSKKLTLYCDRVSSDGKTCKVKGARSKHKNNTESDPVLKKFYQEKHRRYMACERSKLAFDYDGQTIDKYYYWLDTVKEQLEKYKRGEITAEEMIEYLN